MVVKEMSTEDNRTRLNVRRNHSTKVTSKIDNNEKGRRDHRGKKVNRLCTSHAHEAAPHRAGWGVLFGQNCVVVPESASDGAGVAH
jgi:hypothetical protein